MTCQVELFLVASSFVWLVSSTLVAFFGDRGRVSEDDAKVKTLVDQGSLEVLQDHIDLVNLSALGSTKQFANEVRD